MQQVFIIQNQDGYFLGKSGEWLDGRDPVQLYRSEHRDEALNQSVETSSKNVELRLTLMECGVKNRLIPDIPADQLPPELAPSELEEPSPEQHESDLLDSSTKPQDVAVNVTAEEGGSPSASTCN